MRDPANEVGKTIVTHARSTMTTLVLLVLPQSDQSQASLYSI